MPGEAPGGSCNPTHVTSWRAAWRVCQSHRNNLIPFLADGIRWGHQKGADLGIWGDSNVYSDRGPAKTICSYILRRDFAPKVCYENILPPIPSLWSVTSRVNTSEQLYPYHLRKVIPVSFLSVEKS